MEIHPFKYRKSQVAFLFPVIAMCNNILQFSFNIEFQLLFVCDAVSGIFQYFLITVYCISHLHWLLFFVSLEVLFYREKQNRKITAIWDYSSPSFYFLKVQFL